MARIKLATSFLAPDFSFSKLAVQSTNNTRTAILTLKRGEGLIWPPPLFFQKFIFQRKGDALFFCDLLLSISYIFLESFIEIPQLVKITHPRKEYLQKTKPY